MNTTSKLLPQAPDAWTSPPLLDLRGSLQQIGLQALVQLLARSRASGRLRVWQGAWLGELGLDNGRIVVATVDAESGPSALEFTVRLAARGEFAFVAGSPPTDVDPALDAHLRRLLAHADLAQLAGVPAPMAVPVLADHHADGLLPVQLRLCRAALKTLLAIDGRRSVRDIAHQRGHLRAVT